MKHILIPTDFSDCAIAASDFAIDFAQKANAKLDFLHLLSTPVDWVNLALDKEKLYPETKKQIGHTKSELSKWVNKAKKKKVVANKTLIFNKSSEEVFYHIKTHSCDLIVMGSHGTEGLKEMMLGSNAQLILRNTNIPVLIVKNRIDKPIKNMLFVSDFKDISRSAFHTITYFADTVGAHIDLLFVNTPDEFVQSKETDANMDIVLNHCNRDDACTKNIINAETIEKGINDFVTENEIDLIAICTHGKSSILQLFRSSIAENLTNHINQPVLSIKL